MVQSGSATFADPGDYEAAIGIGGASFSLVINSNEPFKARLTWVKQRHLCLLTGREAVPRIARVSLDLNWAFVSFPASSSATLIWGGVALQFGDIVFHSPGERAHQQSNRAGTWGIASLPSDQLAAYGRVLTGVDLKSPPVSRILRPRPATISRLRRHHVSASRLAETKPDILAHEEVGRAEEQEYIHALVNCLTAEDAHGNLSIKRYQEDIALRFDDALTNRVNRPATVREACAAIGVTEQDLRLCCIEILGVSPSRYIQLRRTNAERGNCNGLMPPLYLKGYIARHRH